MKFSLTILGVNSAAPAYGRFPTAQILNVSNLYFLIDCGEGAQMRMADFQIPKNKIGQIFISHLHGDHIFGLPGLLFSYDLNNRRESLDIYSPPGLEEMVMCQLRPGGILSFQIRFHEVNTEKSEMVFENNLITVYSLPLRHRIPTSGYLFREKPRPLNIRPDKIQEFQLTIPQIQAAKSGSGIQLPDGRTVPNSELTYPPAPLRSYAYLSDTLYDETLIPLVEGVDLLYHETTFCHNLLENAKITMHTTAWQAATFAKKANAGKLITGHYSSRYKEIDEIVNEARQVFPNTVAGLEGETYEV